MDVVIVVVLGVLVVLATAIWLRLGKTSAAPAAQVPSSVEPGTDLELREVDDAVELWWPGGGRLATVRPASMPGAGAALRSPWVRRAVMSMLRRVPKPTGRQRYRLTFPPDMMTAMTSGGTVDVVVGGRALSPAAVAGGVAGGTPVALALGAVAMSVAQQQRLDRTLQAIEQRLEHVIDRMRDDDHGRLDAAEALLHQLDRRTAETPSAQLRTELAAARQSIESVYFARRRFGQRLGDAIGDAQNEAAATSGEIQAWAAGVLDAVGDPDQLRSELLVYLRAIVVRARLATSTSAVLAMDGDVADANRLLLETVEELRADFYDLYRRLRPLARWAPPRSLPWRRREWDRAHETVVEVYELMQGEVEPVLPEADPKPIELEAVLDDDGEVEELTMLE